MAAKKETATVPVPAEVKPAKVSRLKGVAPKEVIPTKPKFIISGPSGIGKSLFAMEFPKPYVIDTEGGASREQYQRKLAQSGGAYFGKDKGSQDFKAILDEIKALMTEQHDYKTLIIDSFSKLYNTEAAKAEQEGGSDFGRDKKEANKPTRQLIRYLDKLDMTVILICHSKEKWKRNGKELYSAGTTFDGWDKLEYELDLWIELLDHDNFTVKKSRIESLPQFSQHELKYDKFAVLYGKEIIDRSAVPLKLASPEQVARIKKLLETVKVEEDWVEKCFKKADVDEWEEMTEQQLAKCIEFCKKKLEVKVA